MWINDSFNADATYFQREMKQSVFSVGILKILLNKFSAQAVAVITMVAAWSHLLI